jgi:predicted GIY-YIG superfamily endonuclease
MLELEKRRKKLLNLNIHLDLSHKIPYSYGWELKVPAAGGVYFIGDLRGILYVGLTNNLRRWYDEHDPERDNPLLKRALNQPLGEAFFCWVHEPELKKQRELERQLVQNLMPICNRIQFVGKKKGEL